MSSVLVVKMTIVFGQERGITFFFLFFPAPCAIFVPGIKLSVLSCLFNLKTNRIVKRMAELQMDGTFDKLS